MATDEGFKNLLGKTLLEFQDPYLEFGKLEHDYINRYIEVADRKAGVTFAITTAVLVYFAEKDNGLRWLNFKALDLTCIAPFATMVALIWSSYLTFSVVFPRLAGNPVGLIFWQAVAKRETSDAYAAEILAKTPEELRRARIEHCHELAKVCTRKFTILNQSMAIGMVGIVLFFVTKIVDALVKLAS